MGDDVGRKDLQRQIDDEKAKREGVEFRLVVAEKAILALARRVDDLEKRTSSPSRDDAAPEFAKAVPQ